MRSCRCSRALAHKTGNGFAETAPSLSHVPIIVCGCRDWKIEHDDEVKVAMEGALEATRETYYEQSRAK